MLVKGVGKEFLKEIEGSAVVPVLQVELAVANFKVDVQGVGELRWEVGMRLCCCILISNKLCNKKQYYVLQNPHCLPVNLA